MAKAKRTTHRTHQHYAAHGANASYCVIDWHGSQAPTAQRGDVCTQVAFRRGRVEEGEAVQVQISVTKHHEKRSVESFGSLSLDQATWDALVEFVKENRTLPMPDLKTRLSTKA